MSIFGNQQQKPSGGLFGNGGYQTSRDPGREALADFRRREEEERRKRAIASSVTFREQRNQQPEQAPIGLSERVKSFTPGRGLTDGIARIFGDSAIRREEERASSALDKTSEDIIRRMRDPDTTPEVRQRLRDVLDNTTRDFTGAQRERLELLKQETDARPVIAGAAELGLFAATGAAGRAAGLTRGGTAATQTGRLATGAARPTAVPLSQLTRGQVGRASGVLASEGAGIGALSELQNRETSAGQVGLSALTGGLLGAAIPAAGGLIGVTKRANDARRLNKIDQVPSSRGGDMIDDVIAEATGYQDRYKKTLAGRAYQNLKETLNSSTALRKIDSLRAKSQGKRVTELKATESTEQAYDEFINYKNRVNDLRQQKMSTGQTVSQVYQKHAKDKERFANYLNNRADRYARTKGTTFQKSIPDADLEEMINTYEKAVPSARKDFATLNEAVNEARKVARKAGAITEEMDAKLGNSKEYLPVTAARSEDVPSVAIGGRSATTGKQTFARDATGADVPLAPDLQGIENYLDRAYKNATQARLSQLIKGAVDDGLIEGGRVVSEAGAKATKKELRDYSKEVLKQARKVARSMKFTKKQARTLQSEINKFNKQGLSAQLKQGGKTRLPEFNVEGLGLLKSQTGKTQTARSFFKSLVEADPSDVKRLQSKIATREPKLAAKLQEVIDAQTELSALKSEATGARQAAFEILDDPTTNMSVIRGLDESGEAFTLELPTEVTKLLKGTDEQVTNGFMKGAVGVQRMFQTFWTGVANPIFNLVMMPLYEVASNTNALITNPKAFARSFSPDSFGKMFTGLRNSDEFQKALRSGGASAQGGSLMPQNITKTVDSIMSQRNFASRTGYLVKKPREALQALDQFTGVLGNMTRTRLARGFYKDALKKGMNEAEALAEAGRAYNNMAPNFNRTSAFAKNANAFIPYVTASLSGNRSLWQPILANPGRAAAVYGGITATLVGAHAHNLATEAGEQYYREIREQGKGYILDGSLVIVLPTASKNEETGEWTGVIRIPVAPEFRKINELARGGTEQFTKGESGLSPWQVSSALVNTMTGGVPESATQGPGALRTVQVLAGSKTTGSFINPDPLVQGRMADKPKDEQMYPWTSNPAKFFSEMTGSKISPIQADAIIGQFSTAGKFAQGNSLPDQVRGRFGGSFTDSLPKQINEQVIPASQGLSDRMKASGKDINTARTIAEEHNSMIDGLLAQVQRSNMSDSKKKDEVKRLEGYKASTKDFALKSRLGID